jgi:hypothetical protein
VSSNLDANSAHAANSADSADSADAADSAHAANSAYATDSAHAAPDSADLLATGSKPATDLPGSAAW